MPDSLAFEGRAVAGAALWMAIWWITEAAPIPVTSLLPLVLFPLFGMGTMAEVAAPYADTVIFLVMGGVILGVAVGIGLDPLFMTIAVTLAVCSAFMLPVATPSNAVAFGSGEITIKQMARAGLVLNIISLGMIMLVMYTLVPVVFGISM